VTEPSAPGAGTVAEPPPTTTVAAFDFDGTLTEGGSVYPFLVAMRGAWTVGRVTLRQSLHLLHAALVGGPTADAAKEAYFTRLLGGLPVAEVDRVSADFARHHLARKLRAATVQRLEWHQSQGHHVVIVSASPECYVRVAADELGADGAVATRLSVTADGHLTGGYDGQNCRGTEKLRRLVEHLEGRGLMRPDGTPPELWAYGNSRGDLRLLAAADHGVDVGKLGQLGRLRRYPRLSSLDAAPARPAP
jgi:phosphatidylglycerophosphatase C